MNTKPYPTMVDENGSKAVAVYAHAALVPANMTEATKLAEIMASAKLVPMGLQKSPADCLQVVLQAVRWNMDAFAVAQECSVIQGKLMHSGKLVAAVVNTRGNLIRRLSFEYTGAERSPERTIIVSGQLQGEAEPRTVKVTLKSAKTTAKVWDTQPDQQLMYHGARVWARRHTPELMLGVYSPEEFDDVRADAERDIANGISIHHPDDYSEGTPERLTKAPETPKYSRTEQAAIRWQEKLTSWQSQMDQCETVDALHEWGTSVSIVVASSPPEIKKAVYDYFRVTLENLREAELSDQVVQDSDEMDPRPATRDDFDEGNERASVSSSPPATSEPPVRRINRWPPVCLCKRCDRELFCYNCESADRGRKEAPAFGEARHEQTRPSADARLCHMSLEIARQEALPEIRKMATAFRPVSMTEFSMGDRFELLFLLTMHASVVDG